MATSGSTSPIARLPDEILANIFVWRAADAFVSWCFPRTTHLASAFADEQFAYFVPIHPSSLKIKLLMVCRRWHSIAMSCPSFWRYVVVGKQKSTRKQLELSKQAPLYVYTTLPRFNQRQTLAGFQRVLEEIHRVEKLIICAHGNPRPDYEPDELYMPITAPILRSLSIHHFSNRHDNPNDIIVRQIGHLWDAPRLQHYANHGGREVFPWTSPAAHPALRWKDTLTCLVWLPETESRKICPSADALLEVVHQLPRLHTLQVAFSPKYPVHPLQPLAKRANVSHARLPGLRRLMLIGNLQSCFDIMDHIDHPHLLDQLVVIAGHPLETVDHRETAPLIDLLADHIATNSTDMRQHRAQANVKGIRTLSISPDELKKTNIEIAASTKLVGYKFRFPFRSQGQQRDIACDGQYPDLDFYFVLPERILRTQFETLFGGIVLRDVERLELLGNPPSAPSDIMVAEYYEPTKLHPDWSTKIFSLLDNVHTLRVHQDIDPCVMKSYLLPSTPDASGTKHNFPRLTHIRLDAFGFKGRWGGDEWDYSFSGTFEDLLQLFEQRARAGFKVQNTTLLQGAEPLEKEELIALKQHVSSLFVESLGFRNRRDDRLKWDELYAVPDSADGSWNIVQDPDA